MCLGRVTCTGARHKVPCKCNAHAYRNCLAHLTIALASRMAYTRGVSRDPFKPTTDQSTEFGYGPGHFPNPNIDYSDAGRKSGIPIADPDHSQQYLELMAARRTDLNRTDVRDVPAFNGLRGDHEDFYTDGNTERFGANPPLVQQRRQPPPKPKQIVTIHRMERQP